MLSAQAVISTRVLESCAGWLGRRCSSRKYVVSAERVRCASFELYFEPRDCHHCNPPACFCSGSRNYLSANRQHSVAQQQPICQQHSTLKLKHTAVNTPYSLINAQHSTLNTQHYTYATLSTQHATLNTQCLLNTQHPTLNTQYSIPGTRTSCSTDVLIFLRRMQAESKRTVFFTKKIRTSAVSLTNLPYQIVSDRLRLHRTASFLGIT